MQRAIHLRRHCLEFGWGEFRPLDTGEDAVPAHRCDWEGGTVIAVHNFADLPCTVTVDSGDLPKPIFEVFTSVDDEAEAIDLGRIELEPFGYGWCRCGGIRL
jgi:maltose alpha-D-glucosyltransferase/alpha-amylase